MRASLLVGAAIFAAPLAAAGASISLDVAVARGQVSVEAICLGGATGDRLKLFVQKRVAGELQLSVTPGTIFEAAGASLQSLAVVQLKGKLIPDNRYVRGELILLRDEQRHGYLLQTVCIDYHKSSAQSQQPYTLTRVDARCARIFAAWGETSAAAAGSVSAGGIWALQAAVWMDRAGVSAAELQQKFQLQSSDLKAASAVLQQAEKTGVSSLAGVQLSASGATAAAGLFSSNPQVRAETHSRIEGLPPLDRERLKAFVQENLLHGGKLPDVSELRAGNTRERLAPAGIDLPKLQIPESIEELLAIARSLRGGDEPPAGSEEEAGKDRSLKSAFQVARLLPHLKALDRKGFVRFRRVAARRVAKVEHPLAVEALIVALSDDDRQVREAALEGLTQLTGQELGEEPAPWRQWWETHHDGFEFK